jgi:hypothetical protein
VEEQFRFMSPEWIDMAREQITQALAATDLDALDFTLCEEFTNPPADLRRDDGETIGFFLRVTNGRVEIGDRPAERADLRIVSDYEDALEIARDPDAPAAAPSAMEQRITEGRLQVIGDPTAVPPSLAQLDIHRLLASRTA